MQSSYEFNSNRPKALISKRRECVLQQYIKENYDYSYLTGFEANEAVEIRTSILWDITACSPIKVSRRFGETIYKQDVVIVHIIYTKFHNYFNQTQYTLTTFIMNTRRYKYQWSIIIVPAWVPICADRYCSYERITSINHIMRCYGTARVAIQSGRNLISGININNFTLIEAFSGIFKCSRLYFISRRCQYLRRHNTTEHNTAWQADWWVMNW
jgi:hypothetical protein